jgi:hypothetical protein
MPRERHVGQARRMPSQNGQGPADGTVFTAHAAAAKCVARVIAVSIDACEEANIPLSELQKVALMESALLEFDGFGVQLASLVAVGELLRDLGHL